MFIFEVPNCNVGASLEYPIIECTRTPAAWRARRRRRDLIKTTQHIVFYTSIRIQEPSTRKVLFHLLRVMLVVLYSRRISV